MTEGCEITDSHGYIVQVFLGVLCFLVLICIQLIQLEYNFIYWLIDQDNLIIKLLLYKLIDKRHKERPKRQWKIWMLDNSKQGVSAFVAHMLNVILAVTLSAESELDACNWYFVTIFLDTTLGVFICFIILQIFERIFDRYKLLKFKTGNYFKVIIPNDDSQIKKRKKGGSPDESNSTLLKPVVKISYGVWLSQLIIWNTIVVLSKLLLYTIQSSISGLLQPLINWMFSWLEEQKNVRLILVMMIIPTILNSIQFWIQDNFLKKHEFNSMEKEYVACQIFENGEQNDECIRTQQTPEQQVPQLTQQQSKTSNSPQSNIQDYQL